VAQVVEDAKKQAASEIKKIEDQARTEAEEKAKRILGVAIQRYAGEYVTERTVSVVPLPDDSMKGRIIGREGRNIRALEAATGIDLIIDDTPEAVIISCFNPVRREIAKLALTRLIADGRIHPTRIEEVVQKCSDEVEAQCKEAGEQAVFDLGLHKVHPELVRALGRLKFRSSYAQNLLAHSKEVGLIAGIMAGELGVNVKVARRAGLLHDIGKSVDQEVEGSHAQVGAGLARKYNESPHVCAAIAEHHGDEPPSSVLSHIVEAANILSEQRPGARQELLASYITRLHDLEKLAEGIAGVQKAYAIQAGKELRVLVENAQVSDEQSVLMAKEIAKRIEDEASYPGTVRVCVIRETRSTDYAR
jgi:ribonuclease Y